MTLKKIDMTSVADQVTPATQSRASGQMEAQWAMVMGLGLARVALA